MRRFLTAVNVQDSLALRRNAVADAMDKADVTGVAA
jgi:hypothetical protein